MTLLAAAASTGTGGGPTPDRIPKPVMPTSAPWNATSFIPVETYEGSGETVHLDVVDFAQEDVPGGRWNGWRYWMAHSPYPNSRDSWEDPSLLVSQDGYNWETPAGLTNPVYGVETRPDGGYNSDPDICYDPTGDELVLIFRNAAYQWVIARSSDGVTWPGMPQLVTFADGGGGVELVSGAMLREPDGTWVMWLGTSMRRYTAAQPEGPWTRDGGAGYLATNWHHNVIHAPTPGHYLAISHRREDQSLTCFTIHSGGTQSAYSTTPTITAGQGPHPFDAGGFYRAAITLHENGTHVRCWYSGRSLGVWRVGHTEIPLTEFPTPA